MGTEPSSKRATTTPLFRDAAALGALLWTVVLAVVRAGSIWWTGRPGLGMGDVKLGLVMRLALGWGTLWALYLAAVVGAAVGTAGLASGRWTRSFPLPFAPFIAAGTTRRPDVPTEHTFRLNCAEHKIHPTGAD